MKFKKSVDVITMQENIDIIKEVLISNEFINLKQIEILPVMNNGVMHYAVSMITPAMKGKTISFMMEAEGENEYYLNFANNILNAHKFFTEVELHESLSKKCRETLNLNKINVEVEFTVIRKLVKVSVTLFEGTLTYHEQLNSIDEITNNILDYISRSIQFR